MRRGRGGGGEYYGKGQNAASSLDQQIYAPPSASNITDNDFCSIQLLFFFCEYTYISIALIKQDSIRLQRT